MFAFLLSTHFPFSCRHLLGRNLPLWFISAFASLLCTIDWAAWLLLRPNKMTLHNLPNDKDIPFLLDRYGALNVLLPHLTDLVVFLLRQR